MAPDDIQKIAREQSIHCLGTSAIFEARASVLRRRLQLLSFLGIVVPATIGTAFMTFGNASWLTATLVTLASVLGLVQIVASIWSLTARWEDEFAYALESLASNRRLFQRFDSLASSSASDLEAKVEFRLISVENESRMSQDEKRSLSNDEKRMGMRAALRQLRIKCAGCGKEPLSMAPSSCEVCGNYKVRRF